MNVLRKSNRRMIDQSRASVEAEGFITWLRTDGYTDYIIDCHIRRFLYILKKSRSREIWSAPHNWRNVASSDR
jgi:hypothetical protein